VFLTHYFLGDQITKNEMGRVSGTYGAEEKCILGFGEEAPEAKSSLGRPRHRWEDSIEVDP